jgi:DNA processing protein
VLDDRFDLLKLDLEIVSAELQNLSDSEDHLFDFASATWSLICEPGDTIAGFLRTQLGNVDALVQVVSGASSKALMELLPTDEYLNQNLQQTLTRSLEVWRTRTYQADVFRSLQMLRHLGGRLITPKSKYWPEQLNDLGFGTPAALWVLGDVATIQKTTTSVSVVGSRVVSEYGKQVTKDITTALVRRDKAIVSGGAVGADALAHEQALLLGAKTVAVMAGGLDRLYPSQNQELFQRIQKSGLLISEVAPGVSPTKWRFLQRNRLIAALSQATVVIEAGVRSGTINTVHHANDIGRPVGAIPGAITSVRSAGCHELIKAGKAQLISIPRDLDDLVGNNDYFEQPIKSLGAWEIRALDSIGDFVSSIEEIAKTAGLARYEVEQALVKLAKQGLVTLTSNGWTKC